MCSYHVGMCNSCIVMYILGVYDVHRLISNRKAPRMPLTSIRLGKNVIKGLANGFQRISFLVWNLDVKFMFKFHHNFHNVQGI